MAKTDRPTEASDPLIDQVRETRQRLLRKHRGLLGWVKHLQKKQEQHSEKLLSRPKQAAGQVARQGRAK